MSSECINCRGRPDYMLICVHHICEECFNTIKDENDQRCPECNEKQTGPPLELPKDDISEENLAQVRYSIHIQVWLSSSIQANLQREAEISAQKAIITETIDRLKSDIEYVAPPNAQELLDYVQMLFKYYSEYLSAIETHTIRLRSAKTHVERNMARGIFIIDQYTDDARMFKIKYDPYELLLKDPQLYKEDPFSNKYVIKDKKYIEKKH